MPRSNISPRNSPATSNGSSDLLPFLDPAPTGNLNQTSGKAKVLNESHLNSNGKRSSVFSSSDDNSGSDEEAEDGDSESGVDDDDEDEDETPGTFAPSYSKKSTKTYKAGLTSSLTVSRKKLRTDDDDYEGQPSDAGSEADSSDDSYEGVNDITDEDDEEQDVEMLEEQMIVQSERSRGPSNVLNISNDKVDDWSDFGAFDDQLLFSNTSFFDEDQYFSRYNQLDTQVNVGVQNEVETPTKRRVHFEERHDSSDNDKTPTPSSDDEDDDEIPSDFLQQDCLDPDLRRMIENDVDVHLRNQNRSYEDDIYGDFYEHTSNIYHVDTDPASDGSSGYETDDGETTDEDLPPPATITHPRTLLRRDSSVSLTPESDGSSRPSHPRRRRGPVLGTFVADPNKPVAVVDCTGQRLVVIPAYASSRHDWLASATASLSGTTNNSPRATTMHVIDESESDALVSPTRSNYSPMMSSSANLMMTAVGNDTSAGGQVMGPPEAFYPSNNFSSAFDEDEEDDEDDDGEDILNVDDFIDFGNGSSDEEMDKDFEETDEPTSPVLASPAQPSTTPIAARLDDSNQRTSAERFLDHLDQGVVTAFRRNHTRYQALIRLPHHREFMPANSPSRPASVFRNAKVPDSKNSSRKRKASNYMGGEAVRRKLMDTHRRNNLSI